MFRKLSAKNCDNLQESLLTPSKTRCYNQGVESGFETLDASMMVIHCIFFI